MSGNIITASRVTVEQGQKTIYVLYAIGTRVMCYAGADRHQADYLAGLLLMPRDKRLEHGVKLDQHLNDLKSKGITRGDFNIHVWRGGGNGILRESMAMPLRLCRWLRFAIFSQNETNQHGIVHVGMVLRDYAKTGKHGYIDRPLVLKDQAKLILPH